MTGLYTLAAMGLVCLVAAVVVIAALRASSRAGAAEAEAEATVRRLEQLKQSEKVNNETLGRMADADAASRADTVSRARERMRKRDPRTR